MLWEINYFSTKFFSFLHREHSMSIFAETIWWPCIMSRYTRDFFNIFFDIFKYIQNGFQIKGADTPGCRNTLSNIMSFIMHMVPLFPLNWFGNIAHYERRSSFIGSWYKKILVPRILYDHISEMRHLVIQKVIM
jgi:hypothetical protein